ncbi:unnamed protein product [Orchesella dallaii]|uniref:Uncharacterized protein n=1 Tax=Orchesella dallaii TaxID=48710 RepID=A0ABP1QGU8_9HEXA
MLKVYFTIIIIFLAYNFVIGCMPISHDLTGHLIPWSVNNYLNEVVNGIYEKMKILYPFLLTEIHSTVIAKFLSVILFLITLGPSMIFIESLQVLQTIASFVGFQVVEAMNKHIESEFNGIMEHEDKRLHKMSAKAIWSRDVIDF